MSGYVVIARRSALTPIGGKMQQRFPDEYLVTTRGITGAWEPSIQRATVFTMEDATRAANDYNNKRAVAGAPKSVIRDPLNRQPHEIDPTGRRKIDATNYFWNTVATFQLVATGPQAEVEWQKLKARGRVDHVSDYGSQYVIIGDTLYRYADHWGRFATVTWYINPMPRALPTRPGSVFSGKQGFSIGRVQLSQMKLK